MLFFTFVQFWPISVQFRTITAQFDQQIMRHCKNDCQSGKEDEGGGDSGEWKEMTVKEKDRIEEFECPIKKKTKKNKAR